MFIVGIQGQYQIGLLDAYTGNTGSSLIGTLGQHETGLFNLYTGNTGSSQVRPFDGDGQFKQAPSSNVCFLRQSPHLICGNCNQHIRSTELMHLSKEKNQETLCEHANNQISCIRTVLNLHAINTNNFCPRKIKRGMKVFI